MKREREQPPVRAPRAMVTVLTCRVDGREVTLEQLAAEVVRCGGIARKGAKG
jgi:hypothetical protein